MTKRAQTPGHHCSQASMRMRGGASRQTGVPTWGHRVGPLTVPPVKCSMLSAMNIQGQNDLLLGVFIFGLDFLLFFCL